MNPVATRGIDSISRPRAVLLLVGAAVLWSLGGLLLKLVDWTPLGIAGIRSAIAAGAIMLFMRRLPRLGLSRMQWIAGLSYAGTVVLFVLANRHTTAANSILLQYTAPVWVALLAPVFLGEPTQRRDWFFVLFMLAGMALFFLDRVSLRGLLGMCFALASGLCFAVMVLSLREQREGAFDCMVLGNLLAALVCLPSLFGPRPGPGDWLVLLLLGVVQLGLPYYLYAMAVPRVTALEAILIPMLEPVLNPVWALWGLGERPGPWALLGGVLVLGGVAARSVMLARKETKS